MTIPTELMVSISGIRGTIPGSLSEEITYVFCLAFAAQAQTGPIVVSRDSRPSGKRLKSVVIQALTQAGREIIDADLIPLPTTQIVVEETKAAGAIDITASHNPVEYNGLKFLGADGTFINKIELDTIISFVKNFTGEIPLVTASPLPQITEQAMQWHIDRLLPRVNPGKSFVVAVDAVNGAGSYIIPQFLDQIGCKVLPIAVDPELPFPHVPEPLPINLEWTRQQLSGKTFDLGIVVDPDADRLVLIDEKGSLIWEEATIPLVAMDLIQSGKKGTIIINMSTSRMTEDIATQHGSTVIRSAVGEKNVVLKMQELNAFYGAEGGGGIINPEVHYGRDSLVGLAHIINLLRRTNKSLSQLVEELPRYEMRKTKISIKETTNIEALYQSVITQFPDAVVNRVDGLHLSWPTKWVHLRPSNTEPIFRIIAEAPTTEEVEALLELKAFL